MASMRVTIDIGADFWECAEQLSEITCDGNLSVLDIIEDAVEARLGTGSVKSISTVLVDIDDVDFDDTDSDE